MVKNDAAGVHSEVVNTAHILRIAQKEYQKELIVEIWIFFIFKNGGFFDGVNALKDT